MGLSPQLTQFASQRVRLIWVRKQLLWFVFIQTMGWCLCDGFAAVSRSYMSKKVSATAYCVWIEELHAETKLEQKGEQG